MSDQIVSVKVLFGKELIEISDVVYVYIVGDITVKGIFKVLVIGIILSILIIKN